MLQQPLDRYLVTLQHVQHARRQPGLMRQLCKQQARRRHLLRRLQNKSIAACDRVREHPHRHHRRKIKRRNPRHHTQRLPYLIHIHAGAHLLRVAALQQRRNPASELDVLQTSGNLAARIRQRLAVLRRNDLRQPSAVRVDQPAQLEQYLRPLRQWRPAPRPECLLRRSHRMVHIRNAGQVHRADLPACCRIPYRTRASRARFQRDSADPMINEQHLFQ